jgi:hypothetical protein
MDGARNAVLKLQVHLRNGVLGEDGGIGNITDGGRLDHITDGESLDSLILGGASRAVRTTDRLDMSASLLVATVGSSFLDHVSGLTLGVKKVFDSFFGRVVVWSLGV